MRRASELATLLQSGGSPGALGAPERGALHQLGIEDHRSERAIETRDEEGAPIVGKRLAAASAVSPRELDVRGLAREHELVATRSSPRELHEEVPSRLRVRQRSVRVKSSVCVFGEQELRRGAARVRSARHRDSFELCPVPECVASLDHVLAREARTRDRLHHRLGDSKVADRTLRAALKDRPITRHHVIAAEPALERASRLALRHEVARERGERRQARERVVHL